MNNLNNLIYVKWEKGNRVCKFGEVEVDDETFTLLHNVSDAVFEKLRSQKTTLEQVQDILEWLITQNILQDRNTSPEQKGKLLYDNK
jgi:hypothetical protein